MGQGRTSLEAILNNGNAGQTAPILTLHFHESATPEVHRLLHSANGNSRTEAIDNNYVFCLLSGYEFIMMQKSSYSDATLTMMNTTKTKRN